MSRRFRLFLSTVNSQTRERERGGETSGKNFLVNTNVSSKGFFLLGWLSQKQALKYFSPQNRKKKCDYILHKLRELYNYSTL